MNTEIFDVVVFGGGVIGACVFNALSKSGYKTALLEKATDVAVGASKANSGIVHGGFDAKPGTLKARFNVEGNKMYPEICERLGLPLLKTGAYVIGNDIQVVQDLYNRGQQNGVAGLKILNRRQLLKRIPNITDNVTCGLFCDRSYIVSPYMFNICVAEEGVVNGGKVYLNFEAKTVKKEKGIYKITDGKQTVGSKYVVNCAGAGYNDVAHLFGAEQYEIEFKRGEYYVLDTSEKNLVPTTIFPLPSKHTKGVLVTPTVDGNILVGPTSYESDETTVTTQAGLNEIKEKSSSVINNVNFSKTIRIFSGVRTIVGDDFVVEKSKIVDGMVNVAGICSPGLTASPAIAKYVVELLGLKYAPETRNKKIKPYIKLSHLTDKEQDKMIKINPLYGKIVCRCERVSEGEIIDAINRPIRPTTIDGIKRRARAGMGRCQGGFCADKVALLLAKHNHVPLESVVREYKDGRYVMGNIKEVE